MTRTTVLKQCKALLAVNPKATGTELAIAISGGRYNTPTYFEAQKHINALKEQGKI